jgi:RHS repeat-associated protein
LTSVGTSTNSGAATYVYDGDGNRLAKTVGGTTTQYLIDYLNPTGLPQIVEEISVGAVQRSYSYGLRRISQDLVVLGAIVPSFYGYDGHGDVRLLTNASGAVTDRYDFDAYGNLITATGTTPNVFGYQGEQFDAETGFYYLRARYYNPASGRFISVDPILGPDDDWASNHAYLYGASNPVDLSDPTGHGAIFEGGAGARNILVIGALLAPVIHIHNNFVNDSYNLFSGLYVCIMSEVHAAMRRGQGLQNFGACTNNGNGNLGFDPWESPKESATLQLARQSALALAQ